MSPSEQDYRRMIQGGESQFVEFKRAAVEARHLAEDLVALSNADGGTVFIGVEDDGRVSGIEGYQDNVDELLRCGLDFKFEGTRQLVGQELHIIKREIVERPLPRLIERAFEVIGMHVREYSCLGQDGVFHTIPEYPVFAWQEAIVNAVAHRDYSVTGKAIQVRMFDDRLEVESPGRLPGHVRLDNLVQERFSRNPQIVRVLIEFGYMKDIGEGISRSSCSRARYNAFATSTSPPL